MAQGIGVTVVDPRWVKPVDPALVELAGEHRLVVSVEDNGVVGGCGSVLLQTLNEARVDTPVRLHGIPQQFLDHAKRAAILEQIGLTPQALARQHRRGRDGARPRREPRRRGVTGWPTAATSTSSTTSPSSPRRRAAGPVMLVALDGFLDAGNAGRLAVDHLLGADPGRVVASFDLDAFYDYRARRPPMTFVEDHYEGYVAPRLVVRLQHDGRGTPYLLMHGPEPDTHWEAFAARGPRGRRALRRAADGVAGLGADGGAAHPPGHGDQPRHPPRAARCTRTSGRATSRSRRARCRCSSCGWGSGATTRWASSRTCRTTSPSSTTRRRR